MVLLVKNLPANAGDTRDTGSFNPWVGEEPGGLQSLTHKEWDTTEHISTCVRAHTHTHTHAHTHTHPFHILKFLSPLSQNVTIFVHRTFN